MNILKKYEKKEVTENSAYDWEKVVQFRFS